MNISLLSQRLIHGVTTTLTLVGQRLPFLQHFAPLLTNPLTVRLATPLTTTFVGTHTLTGQTTFLTPAQGFSTPLDINVGEQFTWIFEPGGRYTPASYGANGFPAGVTFSEGGPDIIFNGNNFGPGPGGRYVGAISTPGTYQVNVIGYRYPNQVGSRTPPLTLTINVIEDNEPPTPQELYDQWREDTWPAPDATDDLISGPFADPDGDGLDNLLEYTLELDPLSATALPVQSLGRDLENVEVLIWEIPYLGTGTLIFEEASSLENPDWSEIPAARVEIRPDHIRMSAPIAETPKFFRVRAKF
jgi:hypothetical protein